MDQIKAEWNERCRKYAEVASKKGAKSEAGTRASRSVVDWWKGNAGHYKELMAEWSKVREEDIPW